MQFKSQNFTLKYWCRFGIWELRLSGREFDPPGRKALNKAKKVILEEIGFQYAAFAFTKLIVQQTILS